jgi:hypothetical protein
MDCAGIPEEDEMAINKTEWEQIKVLMRDALAEHDKGNLQRFKSWSPLAAMVAIGLFILTQWNAYTVFRVHTEDRLANIEGRALKAEATSSPATALSQLGEVPQNVFMVAFPALRTISEHSVNEVKPTSAVLHSVAGKLKNTPESAQDYWPTVLQFAHFATSALNPDVPAADSPRFIEDHGQGNTFTFHGTLEKKVIFIAGSTNIRDSVLVKCRIILAPNATLRIQNITFIDCVFDFPPDGERAPAIQQIARSLLASGFTRAWVSPA